MLSRKVCQRAVSRIVATVARSFALQIPQLSPIMAGLLAGSGDLVVNYHDGAVTSDSVHTVQISIVQNDGQISSLGAENVGFGDCNGEQVHGVQKQLLRGYDTRTATIYHLRDLPSGTALEFNDSFIAPVPKSRSANP